MRRTCHRDVVCLYTAYRIPPGISGHAGPRLVGHTTSRLSSAGSLSMSLVWKGYRRHCCPRRSGLYRAGLAQYLLEMVRQSQLGEKLVSAQSCSAHKTHTLFGAVTLAIYALSWAVERACAILLQTGRLLR